MQHLIAEKHVLEGAVDSSITPDQTIISSSEGSIITLTCTYDDSASNLHWYQQKPHSEPEFLLLTSKYTDSVTKAEHDPRLSTKVRKKEKKKRGLSVVCNGAPPAPEEAGSIRGTGDRERAEEKSGKTGRESATGKQ
ncbi:hypothetical protein QTP70_003273 [Hemibagrus guttatus]|uniref:Ig-like domain-containing protein n=1 Tax=Hemibagrus guttatus TaxID=175788 RepID=A0AAE0R865_9TELE|nr:hypothetical protein QTP70_003273 [Hemibagrus guttatus]